MTDAAIPASVFGSASGAAAPAAAPQIDWTRLMLGFGAMVIGQFMAILDIQIVAASLPQIQAGVGASADQVSWIQTAYLIPEVVMIPLSGYLSRLWGTQKVYLVSCTGFIVMSVLTGLSSSIDMMILTRALQGFIGGAMIPTVFAVAFTAFPPERADHRQRDHGPDRHPGAHGGSHPGRPPDRVAQLALAVLHQCSDRPDRAVRRRPLGPIRQGRSQPEQGLRLVRPGGDGHLPDEPAVRA
jgi:hypothetical protein